MKKNSSIVPGLLLIMIGAALLVNKMDWWRFRWDEFYPIALLVLAAASSYSLLRGNSKSAFGASFFLIAGLITFLRNFAIINSLWFVEIWSILLLALGVSFFVLYLFNPHDWGVLIPGGILSFFGVWAFFQDLDVHWFNFHYLGDFWPLILVIIGLGLIVSALLRKRTM